MEEPDRPAKQPRPPPKGTPPQITEPPAEINAGGSGLKNSLYDSYIRAFRWASDRIGDQGVVAFVSNNGWVDGNTADGLRKTFTDEFSDIWVYNLRGNQRTAGEQLWFPPKRRGFLYAASRAGAADSS